MIETCPLCSASTTGYDSAGRCPGCGLSTIIRVAIQKRRHLSLLQLLEPLSVYREREVMERKGAFSYVDIVTRNITGEGTYTAGKVFVGCKFPEGGEAPLIFNPIYRACQRFGLEAQRFFAPVEYPGVAAEVLKVIEKLNS